MSFRNRYVIAGANGPQKLSIPVMGGRNIRVPTHEVMIDNRIPWQSNHWKSISSCYNHAPWFEQYRDSFKEVFELSFEKLVDLNRFTFDWVLKQLSVPLTWDEGELPMEPGWLDYRNKFLPKNLNSDKSIIQYRQVFQERTGFLANLSILDLLFCTGPKAGELLCRS